MHTALKTLTTRGIPIISAVRAIQYINGRAEYFQPHLADMLNELVGMPVQLDDPRLLKYVFLYAVQETILKSFNTDKIDMNEVLATARIKANDFIDTNPWVFAERAEGAPKLDAVGQPKKKKGAKQEMAADLYKANQNKSKKEIIAIFISEIGMSPAGAQTYYYNMKKKFQ